MSPLLRWLIGDRDYDHPGPGRIPTRPREYTDRYAIEADIEMAKAARTAQIANTAIAMNQMHAMEMREARSILDRALPEPTPLPTPDDVTEWYRQNKARTPWGTPQIGSGRR